MKTALSILQYSVAGAFVALGIATFGSWLRTRDRRGAYLALALGLLGLVSILGRLSVLLGNSTVITMLSLVAFQGSGAALLMFRHTFIPISRPMTWFAAAGLAIPTIAAILVGLPATGIAPTPIQTAITTAIILGWSICVGEPSIRFWIASRNRPVVQRRRLRAITLGYVGIIILLLVSGAGGSAANQPAVQVVTQLFALVLAPILYLGFAPPRLVRRIWREKEEEGFRRSVNDLLLFAPNRVVLAERSLDWAVRLVGAEAGFIVDGSGQLIACRGISWEGALDRAKLLGADAGDHHKVSDDATIVVPLELDSGTGYLVAVSGPFTPLFGSDEVSRLEQYGTAIVAALDRTRVAERLSALEEVKSRFLKLASHELRGPLGLVRGYVSMLADGSMEPEAFSEISGTLLRKLDQMSGMLRQMLETARLEDEHLDLRTERIDLRRVVEQVADSMAPFAGSTHRIAVSVPDIEMAVTADQSKVETILTNLVDNAIKYSPAGGEVGFKLAREGDQAVIEVSDEGLGIPEDQMPVLFTRFGRVSNPDTSRIGGTGLGLYLSRELARMQHGDITAHSMAGRGSRFTLRLPLAPAVVQADRANPKSPAIAGPTTVARGS